MIDFKRKYLKGGRLVVIPRKTRHRESMGRFLISLFDAEAVYTEFEVNKILSKVCDDYAYLRRFLVDAGMLARDDRGGKYHVNV